MNFLTDLLLEVNTLQMRTILRNTINNTLNSKFALFRNFKKSKIYQNKFHILKIYSQWHMTICISPNKHVIITKFVEETNFSCLVYVTCTERNNTLIIKS